MINKSLFNLKRCFEALSKTRRVPLRDSELTRLLFENFSKQKLSLNIMLNINCSKIPFIVLNPIKGEIDRIKNENKYPLEHITIGDNRRLSLRENLRRSLNVKGKQQKVSLVEVKDCEDEIEICTKSVDFGEEEDIEWSAHGSCKSFMTHQPKKKQKKTQSGKRFFDEIQKVLDFGNNAKKITKIKLIKNPTIDELKKSAVKMARRNKFKLNIGKSIRFLLNVRKS